MHGDGFGCLHTEDISGHKIEGLPFLRKNHPLSFYSRVVRLAFRPFAQKKGHFLAHVIFFVVPLHANCVRIINETRKSHQEY